ncbi:MopE-related protein [Salinimicrobium terrae]|uniref:MopE-related protein n=1 Tax=Salinimicrobium terrae TaxID=470866 RepID=UPI00040D8D29|nr:MopE-related protein [Salinimicrobium terrae]
MMKNYYRFFRDSACKKFLGAALMFCGYQFQAQTDYIVTTTADAGSGSLREAIASANSDTAKDNIYFQISGEGPHRISLQSPLPEITEIIVLDGTTQVGYSWETPQIIIDGNQLEANGFVLTGNSSGSTIKGFVIGNFIDNNYYFSGAGVGILAKNSGGHTFSGNFIGVTPDGQSKAGNGKGIFLLNSSDNVIGGQDANDRNIISGNTSNGIFLDGYDSSVVERNSIFGNYIGTNITGTQSLSNGRNGIELRDSNHNQIGGSELSMRNLISGNYRSGIYLIGHYNKIQGNYIGISLNNSALGNGSEGITIPENYPLSTENLIGGGVDGVKNIISGNQAAGVSEDGEGTKILGNFIGLGINGFNFISNGVAGISVTGQNYVVGGTGPFERNVVANESWYVINVSGTNGKIQGNFLGTDASGKMLSPESSQTIYAYSEGSVLIEGNLIAGGGYADIHIMYGQNYEIYNNTIGFKESQRDIAAVIFEGGQGNKFGGSENGMGNIIRGGGAGILIQEFFYGDPAQVEISGNQIYDTGGIGIDIVPQYGINVNDAGDADEGPNRFQNYPVLSEGAALEGGEIVLSYFVDSAPGNSTYPIQVEFFIEAGARQAKEYLFYDLFTEADYNAGVPKEISVPLPTGSSFIVGDFILSTATDAGGNTSEFSASVEVTGTCSGPVAVCKDPFTLELGADGTASLTVEDVDNGSTTSCGFQSMSIDKTEFNCEDIGDQLVTLTVTDINNFTVTCTTTVTIQDKILPELTAVLDKEVGVDENCHFVIPDYTGETIATDNCSTPTLTQAPAVGTVLTNHNTTQLITLTADDGNGNINSTSFTITLKDKTKPELSSIADKEATLDQNCSFSIPNYLPEVTVTDNCSTPILVQTPEAGFEVSGNGTVQEIVITANDGNENSSSTSFNLILKDGTDPSISSIQDQTLIADENCQAALGDYSSLVTVSDNCDADLTITQDPIAETVISNETLVTLTVTDGAQNNASTSFTVSLEGGSTTTYYVDSDGDGYGVDDPQTNVESCIEPESGYSTLAGDCNDSDRTVHPGAFDIRGDTIDQDCDGMDQPLDCIGTDRLDITQVCPENSTVETWVISNPSTCTLQVRWEVKNSSLSDDIIVNPGETQFNTPLTNTNKTMLIIYWNDKNGREKRSNIVSKGTECTSTGSFTESQSFSDEIEGMVYPNPIADNGFWISFPPEVGGQKFQAAIYTMNGELLIQQNFNVPSEGGDLFWNFTHNSWPQGLYPLLLLGETQQYKITLIK